MIEQVYNSLHGPIHSMVEFFETQIKIRKINPSKCSLKKQEEIQEKVEEKESCDY